MIYEALDIAKYVINYHKKKQQGISNLKLQKVLYFIQAEFLCVKDIVCFNDKIEAWTIGPVIPKVYQKYKHFGCNWIISKTPKYIYIIEEDKEIIDEIIEECIKFSSSDLTNISLNQEPWINSYCKGFTNEITKEEIKEYFLSIRI